MVDRSSFVVAPLTAIAVLFVTTSTTTSLAEDDDSAAQLARRGARLFREGNGSVTHAVLPKWATDDDLALIKGFARLEVLVVGGTRISDNGLKHFSGLTKLRTLWLADTKITDEGLMQLKPLRELRWLDLHGTKIRGPGLTHLHGLNQLRRLELSKGAVGKSDISRLSQFLPACEIIRGE